MVFLSFLILLDHDLCHTPAQNNKRRRRRWKLTTQAAGAADTDGKSATLCTTKLSLTGSFAYSDSQESSPFGCHPLWPRGVRPKSNPSDRRPRR
uniref:Putative secreted protein n=1 Tax=Anopheles marajoara TaxID=58244 RepID=A0A2M4C9E8_9DIPT